MPYERTAVTMNNTGVLKGGEKWGNSVSLFTPALRKAFTENVFVCSPNTDEDGCINVRLTQLAQDHVH
jgi:hypothetical protein